MFVLEYSVLVLVFQQVHKALFHKTLLMEFLWLVLKALQVLLDRNEVAADGIKYKVCKVAKEVARDNPWDWRNFKSEYSPKSWDPNTPSSYKPLPKGLDL